MDFALSFALIIAGSLYKSSYQVIYNKNCLYFIINIHYFLIFIQLFDSYFQGAAVNVRGPALLDLQRSTGTSIDEITPAVFVTIALGWAVGSVVGGILYDRFEKQLVICVCVTVSGVFTGIVPWCTNVIVLSLVILISGASLAASYTGNVNW